MWQYNCETRQLAITRQNSYHPAGESLDVGLYLSGDAGHLLGDDNGTPGTIAAVIQQMRLPALRKVSLVLCYDEGRWHAASKLGWLRAHRSRV